MRLPVKPVSSKALVALWLGLALGIFAIRSGEIVSLYKLARRGTATRGQIISVHPDNHARVDYRYQVGDRDFTSSVSGHGGAPGQPVTVYYVPGDPALSSLDPPSQRLITEAGLTFIAALVFPTLIVWRIPRDRRTDTHNRVA